MFCNLRVQLLSLSSSLIAYFFQFLGFEKLDPDVPTDLEGKLFCSMFGKLLWMLLYSLFYAFRPMIINPKKPNTLEIINSVIQLCFDAFIIHTFGC